MALLPRLQPVFVAEGSDLTVLQREALREILEVSFQAQRRALDDGYAIKAHLIGGPSVTVVDLYDDLSVGTGNLLTGTCGGKTANQY